LTIVLNLWPFLDLKIHIGCFGCWSEAETDGVGAETTETVGGCTGCFGTIGFEVNVRDRIGWCQEGDDLVQLVFKLMLIPHNDLLVSYYDVQLFLRSQ